METQTLEELKQLNAQEEETTAEETTEEVETEEEETEEHTETETEEEEQSDTEDTDEEETEETDEEEVEAWKRSEKQDSQEDQPKKFTGADVARARRKERAKAEKRVDDELQRLRDENAALKAGRQQHRSQEQQQQLPPRPKLEDYEYDEAKYTAALDDWYDQRMDQRLTARATTEQQSQARENQTRAIEEAVNAHDSRAAGLIASGDLEAEDYAGAEEKVRHALDQAVSGQGDTIADQLISQVGEGSEKLFYYLGKNPNALSTLQGKMVADRTGLQAMLYLGELKAKMVTPPKKPTSKTPKPGKKLKGDSRASGKADALQRQYSKSENVQERISLKRQARAAGVDTSNW